MGFRGGGEGGHLARNSLKGSHIAAKKQKQKCSWNRNFVLFFFCVSREIIAVSEFTVSVSSDHIWTWFMDWEMGFWESSLLSVCQPNVTRKWTLKCVTHKKLLSLASVETEWVPGLSVKQAQWRLLCAIPNGGLVNFSLGHRV